ncbi:MAG: hypothetical protein V8S32_10295 [Lachnospiraceae bacterium]
MHEFEKQVQAWDQEIRQQQEQIEELYDRQDPVEQTDMTDVYEMTKVVRYSTVFVEYNVAGLGAIK